MPKEGLCPQNLEQRVQALEAKLAATLESLELLMQRARTLLAGAGVDPQDDR